MASKNLPSPKSARKGRVPDAFEQHQQFLIEVREQIWAERGTEVGMRTQKAVLRSLDFYLLENGKPLKNIK